MRITANPVRIPKNSALVGDLRRFLLMGGLNTLLTLAIYQLLLFQVSANLAYTLSWCTGLIFVACIYPSKVFGAGTIHQGKAGIMTAAVYIAGFLIGLSLTIALEQFFGMRRLSIFVTIIATTVFNFVVMRYMVKRYFPTNRN